MIWAAVTAANGRFYRAESWADPLDGPGTLRVGDSGDGRQWTLRPALVWPSAGRSLRIAVNGDLVLAVAKGQNGGACIIGNDRGITRTLGATHGESCVGVEALPNQPGGFRVGAVTSAAEWRSWIVDGRTLDATVESTQPVPNGWADGWVDFRNGQPLWLPEYRGRTVLGHQLGIYVSCGDYYIGQSYVVPGIDAINLTTGALARVCSGYSPVQPHAAIVGARIVVAFSADAPQFVCSDDFGAAPVVAGQPAQPTPPVLPTQPAQPVLPGNSIRVPEFAPIQHAMALSFTDKPATKQLCGVGDAASSDHVGVLLTVDKDDHAPAIALARERALPLYAYWDDPGYPLARVPAPDGVRVLPEIQAYPRAGDTVDRFRSRVDAELTAFRARYQDVAVYGCLYRQWNGTTFVLGEQLVLDCAAALWELCRTHRVRVLTWFSWRRPWQGGEVLDGVLKFASFGAAADRMLASCPTRDQFPRQPVVVSVPAQPPVAPAPSFPIPDYSAFVFAEAPKVASELRTRYGRPWTPGELWSFSWRRLSEGWTFDQILAEIRGQQPTVMFHARLPWHPPYEQFVGEAAAFAAEFTKQLHRDPAESDMAHAAWRRLVEKYSSQALIAGITGAAVSPAPQSSATAGVATSPPAGGGLSTPPAPSPAGQKPERVTGAALLDIKANFCNLRDSRNRIVYTPALTGAPAEVFDEWMRIQRDNGSTHVPFGPPIGGLAYPGVEWANPDFWSDLPRLRAFIERVLDTPSADGRGFRPILFVGGDTFAESRFDRWHELAAALEGLHQYLIVLVAWEPVIGGWRTAEVSNAMRRLHDLFPRAKMAGHGSPTRWVSSSNPIEPDDPWQGEESAFFKRHGGEYLDMWFYQTPHGRDIYTACTCPSPGGPQDFAHREDCWLNRFEDGVARLGAGYHGWRVMKIILYETVAYEAFRGQATPEQAREVATAARRVADRWGVQLGYGNGLPW